MKTSITPLRAEVKQGKLVIEIGSETFTRASKPENGGPLEGCKVDGRRRNEWAKDVAREMKRENEIGESPVMRFIDEMMERAANNGSGALLWPDTQAHVPLADSGRDEERKP